MGAASALALIGDPAAVPDLWQTIDQNAAGSMRYQAILALASIEHETAVDALVELLDGTDPTAKPFACQALDLLSQRGVDGAAAARDRCPERGRPGQ